MKMHNNFKSLIKSIISFFLSDHNGICTVKVLSGLAKGTVLYLDLKKESSYWIGTYDKWILDRLGLENIIKPGWVAWDCGSYVGFYASIFRKLVGNNGYVYAFEASGENYDRLKNLPLLNKWDNLQIINEAVGPDHTTIQFVSNQGGASGPAELGKIFNNKNELHIESVTSRGIDELVLERNTLPPDIIKFDLETAEIFALANGDYVYSEIRPLILLELHGQDCLMAAATFLTRYNYTAQDIYFLNDRTKQWYSAENKLSEENYVPHMLYCKPQ
jgi:FkbM family methyltransferase